MNWNCPWCGCRTYHYNSERGRNECDGCGTPVTSEEEETWRNQYEQQILRARAHLEVANWIQAVDLLEPLTRQSPTDKRLYRMLLQAATKDYQDMQMQNRRLRQIAADAWEKLERLGGLEDQTHFAPEGGAQLAQDARRSKQHGHMAVVAACVHDARNM